MGKKYFVIHLIPCRADFAQTMSDEERDLMQQHVLYWASQANSGVLKILGPVFDPEGPYGLGIVTVEDEAHLVSLLKQDPASSISTARYYPMRAVISAG